MHSLDQYGTPETPPRGCLKMWRGSATRTATSGRTGEQQEFHAYVKELGHGRYQLGLGAGGFTKFSADLEEIRRWLTTASTI